MLTRRLGRPVVAAVAVSCAVVLAGCGGGSGNSPPTTGPGTATVSVPPVPGVTATSIRIGSHQPLTGVDSPGNREIGAAAKAYFDYVNSLGGVNGRKIDYRYEDDQSSPIRAKAIVRNQINDGVFAEFNGLVTPTHEAAVGDLVTAGVPDVFVGSGCGCWNAPVTQPMTFGFEPDVYAEGKILASYVAATYPGVPVGVLYQNDEYGQAGLQGVRAVIPATQIVDAESYSTTNTSLAGQVGALRARNVGVVISFSIPIFTAELLVTAANLSYAPKFVVSSGGSEPTAVAGEIALQTARDAVPSGASLLNGVVTASFLPSPEDVTNPWIAHFRAIAASDAAISAAPFDANTVYGMAAAYSFVAALRATGPHLTRASFVTALESLTLSPTGPALAPVTLSPTYHGGFSALRLGTISSGAIALSGPLYTTSTGTTPITQVTAPTYALPPAATAVTTPTASPSASAARVTPGVSGTASVHS